MISDLVAQKIVSALGAVATAQSASGPYQTVVPQGATFPRLIFHIETDNDLNDTQRRAIDATFNVKAVSQIGFKQSDTIMAAVDTALQAADFDITGWTCYRLDREMSTPRLADPREGGGYYFQAGAVYRARYSKEL